MALGRDLLVDLELDMNLLFSFDYRVFFSRYTNMCIIRQESYISILALPPNTPSSSMLYQYSHPFSKPLRVYSTSLVFSGTYFYYFLCLPTLDLLSFSDSRSLTWSWKRDLATSRS